MSRRFFVTQGSSTEGDAALLVNASNTNCNLGSGVSGAIRAACGPRYQEHIHTVLEDVHGGPMVPAQVLITNAGSHPTASYVAHVAVMDYRHGFTASSYPDEDRIRACCDNLWSAIEALGRPELTVAMVALGSGTGRLGVRRSNEIACQTLRRHLLAHDSSNIGDVTFYGYTLPEYVVTLEVVSSCFTVPKDSIPAEVREHLARLKGQQSPQS